MRDEAFEHLPSFTDEYINIYIYIYIYSIKTNRYKNNIMLLSLVSVSIKHYWS